MYYLGFDIGGSSVKAALVMDKKIIKTAVYDLPVDRESLLNLIMEIKSELTLSLGMDGIKGIGFSVAGTPNRSRDIMLRSYNIKYLNNQPIRKLFEERLTDYPIKIEHDINCFLLAEKEVGLARNLKDVFYLTLGHGIGSAWMINGEIFIGAHGGAGEAGHMIVDITEGLDLEELGANKFLLRSLGFGSMEAEKSARAGDQKTIEILKKMGENIGVGLANIINIIDPEAIIIGGGIASLSEFILPGIQPMIEKFVISPDAKKTTILFSSLGRFGGALGATMLFNK